MLLGFDPFWQKVLKNSKTFAILEELNRALMNDHKYNDYLEITSKMLYDDHFEREGVSRSPSRK